MSVTSHFSGVYTLLTIEPAPVVAFDDHAEININYRNPCSYDFTAELPTYLLLQKYY